jgi:hypothetical protein
MWQNGFHQINDPIEPATRKRADQIGGGVFLIGLAVLFMTGNFFPGILIVIGLAGLASEAAKGKRWQSSGALVIVGIGLVFTFGFSLPLLLIIAGIALLMGWKGFEHQNWNCGSDHGGHGGKPKNDFKRKRHEYSENPEANDVVVVGKSFQA